MASGPLGLESVNERNFSSQQPSHSAAAPAVASSPSAAGCGFSRLCSKSNRPLRAMHARAHTLTICCNTSAGPSAVGCRPNRRSVAHACLHLAPGHRALGAPDTWYSGHSGHLALGAPDTWYSGHSRHLALGAPDTWYSGHSGHLAPGPHPTRAGRSEPSLRAVI
eukprot:364849-Chlamydomonas_euryale.AAC.15